MDVHGFWADVLRQDAEAIRGYFHPEAEVTWPCSNERFTLEEYIRANCEYPGEWAGEVETFLRVGDEIVAAVHVHTKDNALSFHAVSFITLRDGKIAALNEYWGDDGAPPQWRQDMGIGKRIQ